MTLLDFAAFILAADAIVSAWFYGSIFEKWRESIEKREGLFWELLSCPFCLSYHVPFYLALLIMVPVTLAPEPWSGVIKMAVYSLAATNVVHFLQGIRPFKEEEDEDNNE